MQSVFCQAAVNVKFSRCKYAGETVAKHSQSRIVSKLPMSLKMRIANGDDGSGHEDQVSNIPSSTVARSGLFTMQPPKASRRKGIAGVVGFSLIPKAV
jgi:hypothetical protein